MHKKLFDWDQISFSPLLQLHLIVQRWIHSPHLSGSVSCYLVELSQFPISCISFGVIRSSHWQSGLWSQDLREKLKKKKALLTNWRESVFPGCSSHEQRVEETSRSTKAKIKYILMSQQCRGPSLHWIESVYTASTLYGKTHTTEPIHLLHPFSHIPPFPFQQKEMDEVTNLKHFLPLWSFIWNEDLGSTIPLVVPNPLGKHSGLQPFLTIAVGATPLVDVLGGKRKIMQLTLVGSKHGPLWRRLQYSWDWKMSQDWLCNLLECSTLQIT